MEKIDRLFRGMEMENEFEDMDEVLWDQFKFQVPSDQLFTLVSGNQIP